MYKQKNICQHLNTFQMAENQMVGSQMAVQSIPLNITSFNVTFRLLSQNVQIQNHFVCK